MIYQSIDYTLSSQKNICLISKETLDFEILAVPSDLVGSRGGMCPPPITFRHVNVPFFLFDKARQGTVLLKEIFLIFEFSTGNSINFFTTENQFSGQFNFKPSRVLCWPKIAKRLRLHHTIYSTPLRPCTILT